MIWPGPAVRLSVALLRGPIHAGCVVAVRNSRWRFLRQPATLRPLTSNLQPTALPKVALETGKTSCEARITNFKSSVKDLLPFNGVTMNVTAVSEMPQVELA